MSVEQFNISVGKRLKQARLNNRVTLTQLSNLIGIYPYTLQELESGQETIPAFIIHEYARNLNKDYSFFYELD